MPTDYDNMIKWDSDSGGDGGGEEQDYLSKLAQSILKKDRKPAAVPTDRRSSSGMHRLPPSAPRPHQQTRAQMEDLPPPSPPPLSRPQAQAPQPPVQPPQQRPSGVYALPGQEGSRGWRREVDLIDSEGKFLPGTIIVFEDGTLGVQKEYQPAKDYDIVYQLLENGRAVPQGIPLHNYDVEAIGRLGQLSLDHMVKTSQWERDAIVFHLVKFKDVAHVPHPNKAANQEHQSRQSYIMPKLTAEDLKQEPESDSSSSTPGNQHQNPPPVSSDKPQRGMKMIIDFGPGRSWNAIYWGKDELGHVVAHNTHDKWSLMHLDLQRFKDTIQWGEKVNDETIASMSKDFENQ